MNAKFEELSKQHEAIRQIIIRDEGEIDPFKSYPELDAIAHEMFMILSGGSDHITLSAEWVIENASN